jgi:hypothetical protein
VANFLLLCSHFVIASTPVRLVLGEQRSEEGMKEK